MIQEAIRDLIAGADLDRAKMRAVMEQIMSGQATDAQIGAFLVALRIKGETVDEIARRGRSHARESYADSDSASRSHRHLRHWRR